MAKSNVGARLVEGRVSDAKLESFFQLANVMQKKTVNSILARAAMTLLMMLLTIATVRAMQIFVIDHTGKTITLETVLR